MKRLQERMQEALDQHGSIYLAVFVLIVLFLTFRQLTLPFGSTRDVNDFVGQFVGILMMLLLLFVGFELTLTSHREKP